LALGRWLLALSLVVWFPVVRKSCPQRRSKIGNLLL